MTDENQAAELSGSETLRTRIAAAIESVGTVDRCCAWLAAKAVITNLELTVDGGVVVGCIHE